MPAGRQQIRPWPSHGACLRKSLRRKLRAPDWSLSGTEIAVLSGEDSVFSSLTDVGFFSRPTVETRRTAMRWEELSGDQFAEAVKTCDGVCLVALSVVERHGHHLPLGTDTYQGRGMLSRVAALEPVIEFPDYIFTQIPEARHLPGTISIDGELMIKLLDNVCREIARNGCKKVVLLNAHGGNFGLVALYNMLQLYTPKDYVVYIVSPFGAMGELELP